MSLYRFLGQIIGEHSYDWSTFILCRKKKDIEIRKYPNTIGISKAVLFDVETRGCQVIIVKIDGRAMLKTTPRTWINKGITDKLSPEQEPHSFLPYSYFKAMSIQAGRLFKIKKEPQIFEDAQINNYIRPEGRK